MDILYVGSIFPDSRVEEIWMNSKDGIDNAANNLQSALVTGLDHYYPNLRVITLPAIRQYPLKYKKIIFKKSLFSHKPGTEDYCLGFINIPIVKHASKYSSLYRKLSEIISVKNETIIIIYGVHSPYLKAICDLKIKRPKLKTCLIVPDLPQFMSESRNPIYRFLKAIDSIVIKKYLKEIDSFVLLSDQMIDALNVGNRPWTRVEGIFVPAGNLESQKSEDLKIILYTGTLAKRYGVANLLDAFASIDNPNYRLWICGEGDYRQEIINSASLDNRIKYLGQIPFKEVLKLQKQSTVLVNPRTSGGEFTKYSFPSKTMEYLGSGTPCIMHRLPGIPSEYYSYIFIAKKETAEGLKETILDVCGRDQLELNEFGKKAAQFMLENKNPISQVKKIRDLISKL